VECGNANVTKLVANHKRVDVNAYDASGFTALHSAASAGALWACVLLLNCKRVQPTLCTTDNATVLHYLARCCPQDTDSPAYAQWTGVVELCLQKVGVVLLF
jgi:ankyrin repeat protein